MVFHISFNVALINTTEDNSANDKDGVTFIRCLRESYTVEETFHIGNEVYHLILNNDWFGNS